VNAPAIAFGNPQDQPGVTTLGVPNALASLCAKANSMPFGSPSPKATDSAPKLRFNSLSLFATVSSASSQEMRCHLPSPRAPTLFWG